MKYIFSMKILNSVSMWYDDCVISTDSAILSLFLSSLNSLLTFLFRLELVVPWVDDNKRKYGNTARSLEVCLLFLYLKDLLLSCAEHLGNLEKMQLVNKLSYFSTREENGVFKPYHQTLCTSPRLWMRFSSLTFTNSAAEYINRF